MSLQLAYQLASQGRGNDSTLVHMSPKEVGALQAIAAAHGGQLTINPTTGLPEAGFLQKLLPTIAGMALTATTGIPAWAIGLGVGGATAAATGSLNKGIMAGLGAYGGGSLGAGLMAAGAETAAGTLAPAAVAPAAVAPAAADAFALANPELAAAHSFQTTAASPSMMENLSSNASQMGKGFQNLGTKQGFDNFIGNAATKTSEATGLGGGMGAFKTAGALAMPMMADSSGVTKKPPEGNIMDYSYDPISGTYRKLRTTPVSQYDSSTMMAAKGGITHALHYAEGGATYSQSDLDAIDAAIASANDGSKTDAEREAIRDQLLSSYSADALAAAPSLQSLGFKAEDYQVAQSDLRNSADSGADDSREKATSAAVNGDDPKALRAAIQAGPQTQAALDAAYMKYTPAQLQAAFPEYGRVSDYNRASQEAYSRQEAKDAEGRRANPNYVSVAVGGVQVSKVPQSEIDAAQAAAQAAVKTGELSQEDYDFLVWRLNEYSGISQQKISKDYERQGSNPFDKASWSIAKEANATAARREKDGSGKADWMVPGYAARQTQRDKEQAARDAAQLAAQNPNVVVGPGGTRPTGSNTPTPTTPTPTTPTPTTPTPTTPGPTGTRTTTRAQLQSYWNTYFSDMEHVPVGSSQAWAKGTITKTSPTTATYTPTGGKAVTLTQGMDVNTIIQQNPNIAEQWQTEYGYTYTAPPVNPTGNPTGVPKPPRAGTAFGNTTPTDKATMQKYYDQYFTDGVPIGTSQAWGGGTIVKDSANKAFYTDSRGVQHILEKGMDVDSVYAMSPDIAAQWDKEFLYTAASGVPKPGGPTTNATLTPYSPPSGLETPFAFSKQGALTAQGVMGGSEKGGTVGNASQMVPAYQQYWQNSKVGDTIDWAGGKLTRTGGAQAVYTGADGKTSSLSPTSDLNILAANNPAIGSGWAQEAGFVPQNYMTGESARGYEFLRGNAPYSVNQQIRGISRPYGEMALGLPGPSFGQTTLNQQAIDDATAAKIKDSKVVIPDAQMGYGVTNAGTYNMEQVYDPSTQRYMKNNMFTDPSKALQARVANTAGPSNPQTTDPNAGITTGGGGEGGASEKNGGLLARGGLSDVAQHYNLGDYSDGGRLLRGPGDGVSDSIPATIGGKREARLADGEFVVPARIVSELGNGSTEAGARQLYAMMDRIQHNRSKSVGKGKVAVNSKSSKFLPA